MSSGNLERQSLSWMLHDLSEGGMHEQGLQALRQKLSREQVTDMSGLAIVHAVTITADMIVKLFPMGAASAPVHGCHAPHGHLLFELDVPHGRDSGGNAQRHSTPVDRSHGT